MITNTHLSENAANTRTLILSLIAGLAIMVPLSFYVDGQKLADIENEYGVQGRLAEYKAVKLANNNRRFRESDSGVVAYKTPAEPERAVLGVNTMTCITNKDAVSLLDTLHSSFRKLSRTATYDDLVLYAKYVNDISEKLCK